MKTRLLTVALLVTGGLIVSCAFAADGNISISGEISATSCSISGGTGGGPGSGANFPVVLERVQVSALTAEGATAGSKAFFIYVGGDAGCPDGTNVAVLYESSSPAINPATGNLRNTASATPAANVEVQIIDVAANKPVDLRSSLSSSTATIASGLATLPFVAQYIATGGPAAAGLVSTSVQYSVTHP